MQSRNRDADVKNKFMDTEVEEGLELGDWEIAIDIYTLLYGFPCSSVNKESTCNARDPGLIPGSGRSPGGAKGNPLQSSCLESPMDRGAWRATVHRVARVRQDLARPAPKCHHQTTIYSTDNC